MIKQHEVGIAQRTRLDSDSRDDRIESVLTKLKVYAVEDELGSNRRLV